MKIKSLVYFISILAVVFTILTSFTLKTSVNTKKYLSVEKAIKAGLIEAKIVSKGGHTGYCMVAKLKSRCAKDTFIYFEAGRRLKSVDSTKQDILITQDQPITLFSGEEKTVNIYGFCCQSHRGSPVVGGKFEVGKMADTPLVLIAQFCNKKRKLPANVVQNAVWTISDNHSLASVHNDDMEEINELRNYIAQLKGIQLTWYTLTYQKDNSLLFSNKPEKLFGEIKYYLPNNTYATLAVFDSRGNIMNVVFEDVPHNPDTYNYAFSLDVSDFPKGKYYIRLFDGVQKKLEKVFEL